MTPILQQLTLPPTTQGWFSVERLLAVAGHPPKGVIGVRQFFGSGRRHQFWPVSGPLSEFYVDVPAGDRFEAEHGGKVA